MTTLTSTFELSKANFFALLERRISEKGDFPALSKSIQGLRQLIYEEERNIADIANAILSDFTLTQKIIKLVNSGMYAEADQEITTISHAIAVLGLDTITSIAHNVRTIDTPSAAKAASSTVYAELEKAFLASDIAKSIVSKSNVANGEEAIVCTQLHHLGHLILVFYFPEEWARIQQVCGGDHTREDSAALEVIGMTIDEISHEIAKDWQLPAKISSTVSDLSSLSKADGLGSTGWVKTMAGFSKRMAALLANNISPHILKNFISHHSESLLIPHEVIWRSIESIQNKTGKSAAHSDTEIMNDEWNRSRKRIAAGLLQLSIALGRGIDFRSALSITLEVLHDSMGFNRVIAFFRDDEEFKAGLYVGNLRPEKMADLYFSRKYAADVFHLALRQKADVFIQDVALSRETTIPIWFRKTLPDARSFILLPLVFNNSTIGIIYADWRTGQTRVIRPREFSSLVMLRNYLMKALMK
ncbi:HDOD domain-containing protein [Nitrosomonas sp. Is35]|uniref:HDOD domain-containing protein n=1 Tax=Nitrosomonas sp. Is35 TaxID=3080534 RepID=UPI00294A9C99|nr:HDOD domain-containing protein [Nitrosomonas sp. Is35]MDV6348173.1 HDOD domain-containing protein [Nitrosomonas sp. Is35]